MHELLSEHGLTQEHPKKISILLADDHPLLRQALRSVLDQQADFEVVAEVSDGDEVVKVAAELVPDVVIMDISMPKLNGLEATRQIKAKYPGVAILVLTVHGEAEHVLGLLEAGAAGYLTKSVFGEEVVHAIRAVAAGETVLSAASSRQILKHALRLMTKPSRLDPNVKINARELQVLKLAATGMSNKEIALNLELSLRTVKGYLADIFSKLGVASRTEAVIVSLRAGIITLDDLG
jgi:NarL family two-component system response regulator LiaR